MEAIKGNTSNKIMAWIIPLEAILLQYKIGSFNVGVILMLIVWIIKMCLKKEFLVDREFGLFTLLLMIQQLLSVFILGGDINNRVANLILALMIFLAASNLIDEDLDNDYSVKICLTLAIIYAVPIFLQAFVIYGLGHSTSAIMLLPQSEENMAYWHFNSYRPSGFFSEPQTYCTYMLPFLIIALKKNKKKIAAILLISIILSGSSLGIVTALFLLGTELLSFDISTGKKILIVFMIIIAGAIFTTADLFASSYSKITDIFNTFSSYSTGNMVNSSSYSNYLRLVKGWVTFAELPINAKIFGVGMSGFRYYMSTSGTKFSWNNIWNAHAANAAYYSSFSGVLIECGIILGIIYYIFILKKIKDTSAIGKMVLITMLLQSLFSQMFFNGVFVMNIFMYYAFTSPTKRLRLKV